MCRLFLTQGLLRNSSWSLITTHWIQLILSETIPITQFKFLQFFKFIFNLVSVSELEEKLRDLAPRDSELVATVSLILESNNELPPKTDARYIKNEIKLYWELQKYYVPLLAHSIWYKQEYGPLGINIQYTMHACMNLGLITT